MNEHTSPLLGHPATSTDARIGRVIEVLLDLVGVPKQDLAERIGISAGYLGQKISGARPWKADELERVAAALGFPVSVLHTDPEEIIGILREPGRSINYRSSA